MEMAQGAHVDVDSAEIAALADEFETTAPQDVISWANYRFATRVSVVCSFQDCVLIDLAVQSDPSIEVIFLDTGYHFAETLAFVEEVRALYDLNLRIFKPGAEAREWPCGTARCCELRKVAPLDNALKGRDAWITGLKRCDSPSRADTQVVSWDEARGLVKVNPLATWSDEDIANYLVDHDLPVHPLVAKGYLSIGCAPTTRPVAPGEDPRAGRWAGTSKTECGLHA
jgi:phosphoadenosine phosphosulfate reductase